jgi:hypothetical protein
MRVPLKRQSDFTKLILPLWSRRLLNLYKILSTSYRKYLISIYNSNSLSGINNIIILLIIGYEKVKT